MPSARIIVGLIAVVIVGGEALVRASDSAVDQAEVDTALARWEKKTSETKTFKCHFTCLRYDPVFYPSQEGKPERPMRTSEGTIYYAAPDRAAIFESEAWHLELNPASRKLEERLSPREHWTFDGECLYRVDDNSKSVEKIHVPAKGETGLFAWFVSRFLPIDGDGKPRPLEFIIRPFGFAVSADDLKQRFSIELIAPRDANHTTRLEFRPKSASDRGRVSKVDVILGVSGMPSAIQICSTNGTDREVLLFDHEEFNPPNPFPDDTFAPRPKGYKLIESSPRGESPKNL